MCISGHVYSLVYFIATNLVIRTMCRQFSFLAGHLLCMLLLLLCHDDRVHRELRLVPLALPVVHARDPPQGRLKVLPTRVLERTRTACEVVHVHA
jgi:hypothetical protein